jgi:murein DD-endopeptidase MepM/ murein hydrolase activator NlpD
MRTVRRLVVGAVLALSLAVAALAMMGAQLPRSATSGSILEENLMLKSRLQDIERTLSEVEDQLRRLRMYDQQLQDLRREGFSGYGPVADDEANPSELASPDGLTALDVDPATGEFGEPMHALEGLALDPVFMSPVDAWSHDVQSRAEHILALAKEVEPAVGLLVETAEDARARRSAYPSMWPTEGHFTSGFGYRRSPFGRLWKFHSGIDVSAPRGTKVRAASSGVIVRAEYSGGYGKLVEVDHGYGVTSRYAHNSQMFVKAGQVVQKGQVISTVGTTGQSTGPHLHFEVVVDGQKVNPMAYLPKRNPADRANTGPIP